MMAIIQRYHRPSSHPTPKQADNKRIKSNYWLSLHRKIVISVLRSHMYSSYVARMTLEDNEENDVE